MAGAVLVSTFSVQPWADACNPEGPGWRWRAAALAADSATLHRLPVRRVSVSCDLLQTNVYTPFEIAVVKAVTRILSTTKESESLFRESPEMMLGITKRKKCGQKFRKRRNENHH